MAYDYMKFRRAGLGARAVGPVFTPSQTPTSTQPTIESIGILSSCVYAWRPVVGPSGPAGTVTSVTNPGNNANAIGDTVPFSSLPASFQQRLQSYAFTGKDSEKVDVFIVGPVFATVSGSNGTYTGTVAQFFQGQAYAQFFCGTPNISTAPGGAPINPPTQPVQRMVPRTGGANGTQR